MLVKEEEAGQDALGHAHPTIIIQEGLVESSTDDYRARIPLDALDQAPCQSLKEVQECGRGFSEPPEANPSALEDACSIVSVHTGAPDVNTAANNSTSHQPQRSSSGSSLSSEYSVLDLENLFTRWAPDSGAPPAGPSCSTAREVSAEEEEEDRVIIEEEEQEAPLMRGGGSQRSSRTHSFHTITPAVSTGSSLSAALPLQAPPPQLTWSRATAMMRTAQTQSLQQGRHGDRTTQHHHHAPHNTLTGMATAGVSGGHVGGARIRRFLNYRSFPDPSALPPTGLQTRGYAGKGLSGASAVLAGVSTELDGVGVGLESVGIGSDGVSTGLEGVNMGIALQHHVRPFGHSAAGSCERRKRNHVCRACGKAFLKISNLEAHKRVHTGEKPFTCTTCGKRFSVAGNLKKHQRVHSGEKPYSCELCGKRFAWICSLRRHQQSGGGGCVGAH